MIDSDRTTHIEVQRDVMGSTVASVYLPGEIRHRARHHIEIIGEGWRKETQAQFDLRILKGHQRTSRRNVAMHLLERRKRSVGIAQIPPRLMINANDPVDGLRTACPVPGGAVREMVVHRPDTEIRIVDDERRSRSAQPGGLLRERGEGGAARNREQRDRVSWRKFHRGISGKVGTKGSSARAEAHMLHRAQLIGCEMYSVAGKAARGSREAFFCCGHCAPDCHWLIVCR